MSKGIKLSDGENISGRGRLTLKEVDSIQHYYGLAIRKNLSSVEDMKRAIWAIYFHKLSTEDNPQHALCPLGEDSWRESYSNLLTPILLKQIPSELVLEFNRSQKDEGCDLSALLRFLHFEIRCRERASQINSHKLCHYSPPPQDRTKNKGSYFQHMKPTPNRVHFRPHSFPTLLEKVELRSRKCLYCNKGHELDTCRSFGAHEKREILREKAVVIYVCRTNGHDDHLSPKRDTDNIVSAVIKRDSEDILTMSVIVNESNISKQLSEFWNLENLGIEAEVSDEENIDNDIMSEFEAEFQTKISGIS
ncbi:uncharacterized protein TNCV_4257871 [Trichonephila clavipes]|nr:uncharacterized protein TNCV_4257871 [Trichonephila clavipes]